MSYYSIASSETTEKYLAARKHDFQMRLIAASRYNTLKSHLKYWVVFIDRKKKAKDFKTMSNSYKTDYNDEEINTAQDSLNQENDAVSATNQMNH